MTSEGAANNAFDEVSVSNHRSVGKTRKKVKVFRMPRITPTGTRAETKAGPAKARFRKGEAHGAKR